MARARRRSSGPRSTRTGRAGRHPAAPSPSRATGGSGARPADWAAPTGLGLRLDGRGDGRGRDDAGLGGGGASCDGDDGGPWSRAGSGVPTSSAAAASAWVSASSKYADRSPGRSVPSTPIRQAMSSSDNIGTGLDAAAILASAAWRLRRRRNTPATVATTTMTATRTSNKSGGMTPRSRSHRSRRPADPSRRSPSRPEGRWSPPGPVPRGAPGGVAGPCRPASDGRRLRARATAVGLGGTGSGRLGGGSRRLGAGSGRPGAS